MRKVGVVLVVALAGCGGGGGLELEDAWARPTAPSAPSAAVYVTVMNTGDTDEVVVSATVGGCEVSQIHETVMDGAVMRMQELTDGLVVPAGGTVTMEPGGVHVMCMHPASQLEEGDTITVTLTTESGTDLSISVPVEDR